jgi:hypothetical protein
MTNFLPASFLTKEVMIIKPPCGFDLLTVSLLAKAQRRHE